MNILITGAWQGAQNHIKEIENMGHQVKFMQCEKDPLPCEASWVEGAICNGLFLHHEIEKFTNLRYIQITSAGYDRVPMDYVEEHGIEIHNARGVYSIPMAEFAIAGVLELYKKMRIFAENQHKHNWSKQRDILELYGKKVSIVGMGSVGQECAKRFEAFGCKISGIGRNDDLDAGLKDADIIILTLPQTEETYHLINAEKLKLPSNTAIWVNISRGAVIDQQALIKHLQTVNKAGDKIGDNTDERMINQKGGAVLDVFEEEPLPEDSPLWNMENVIVTPHNSFVGDGNGERLGKVILKNISLC